MDVLKKTPVREQDAKVRATNFEEVCYGYNKEEAMEEASRCLKCKNNAKCMGGCPVSINIPGFIKEVEAGNFEAAANVPYSAMIAAFFSFEIMLISSLKIFYSP